MKLVENEKERPIKFRSPDELAPKERKEWVCVEHNYHAENWKDMYSHLAVKH